VRFNDSHAPKPAIYSGAALRKSPTKQIDFIDHAAVQHTFAWGLTGQGRLTDA
jgi:hypothetical protein